jgi:hypothetical protein
MEIYPEFEKLNTVKMFILSRKIYTPNAIPIRVPVTFLADI